MLTINISARVLAGLVVALVVCASLVFYIRSAHGDQIIQGDTNCDGSVNSFDALADLRFEAGAPVPTSAACPMVGSVAAGPNLFAYVDTNGGKQYGTASSSTKTGPGTYDVTFPQDVSHCAAQVTPGYQGASTASSSNVTWVQAGAPTDNDVTVTFRVDPFLKDSDFYITVTC